MAAAKFKVAIFKVDVLVTGADVAYCNLFQ
jgi:hypothetical protein